MLQGVFGHVPRGERPAKFIKAPRRIKFYGGWRCGKDGEPTGLLLVESNMTVPIGFHAIEQREIVLDS